MMLYKLSYKNIQKSLKDYAIYFFTLILGVAIFYVFNAIESQTVLLKVTSSTQELIKLMTNLLSGVSVFVSFILGFLIIYASRFLIKRRNKEFGIYLTLGMSKRKISFILFFETLLIGILSLIVGLAIGVGLSQLMSMLVASMFEADMTQFKFIFSSSACLKCLGYFSIMYLLVMIFNTITISKCKLIDLLQASKKAEKVKLKNPVFCTIIFILAAATLGYAYYLVTAGIDNLQTADQIFIPIILGSVSTFFIFWSLSGLILKIVMSMKKLYYKELNSFTLRQISSKINTTVFSMTLISLMLFITICVLSSSLSLKNSLTSNMEQLVPVDVQLSKKWNLSSDTDLSQEVVEDSKESVKFTLERENYDWRERLSNITELNTYSIDSITFKTSFGDTLDPVMKQWKYLNYDTKEQFLKISDYNKVAKLYGLPTYTVKKNQYIVIADFDSMVQVRNIYLKEGTPLTIGNNTLIPKYSECKEGFIEMSPNHINSGLILVSDEILDDSMKDTNFIMANYKTTSKQGKEQTEEELKNLFDATWNKTSLTSINTKIALAESSIGLGALVTFIGLYLGIIFLISSAAILALKELSESADNKERFRMLRKLGADEKMINKALFRQIGLFFLFPLIIALIHSIFGIRFCSFILQTFGNENLLPSIIMTAIFLVLIYGGYFLITYFCSKNIMKEK